MKSEISATFTFLTAAIVLGVVLIFGGWGVLNLMRGVEDLEQSTFENEFQRAINRMTAQFGSVRVVQLPRIQGNKMLCVVGRNKMEYVYMNFSNTDMSDYPLIRGEIQDNTSNVFLIRHDDTFISFLNDNLHVPEPATYLCYNIPSSGLIEVRLEGFGRYTELSFT